MSLSLPNPQVYAYDLISNLSIWKLIVLIGFATTICTTGCTESDKHPVRESLGPTVQTQSPISKTRPVIATPNFSNTGVVQQTFTVAPHKEAYPTQTPYPTSTPYPPPTSARIVVFAPTPTPTPISIPVLEALTSVIRKGETTFSGSSSGTLGSNSITDSIDIILSLDAQSVDEEVSVNTVLIYDHYQTIYKTLDEETIISIWPTAKLTKGNSLSFTHTFPLDISSADLEKWRVKWHLTSASEGAIVCFDPDFSYDSSQWSTVVQQNMICKKIHDLNTGSNAERPAVSGYLLMVNGTYPVPNEVSVLIDSGYIMVSPMTNEDGSYPVGTEVTLSYYSDRSTYVASWIGVDRVEGPLAKILMDRDRNVVASIAP